MNKKIAKFSLILLICGIFLCFIYYFTHDIPIAEVLSGNPDDVVVKWILPPTYYDGTDFSEGRAWVQEIKDGSWTLIDDKGNIIRKGLEALSISEYRGGIATFFSKEDLHESSFVDLSGDIVFQLVSSTINKYGDGLISNRGDNGLYGFIDLRGEWAISPDYDDVLFFSEGLAPVRKGEKWGYIDKSGDLIIDCQYDLPLSFSHGVAVVGENSLYGLIDKEGNILAEPEYEAFYLPWSDPVGMQKNGRVGFIDSKGNIAIDFKFPSNNPSKGIGSYLYCFNGDLAVVILDEKTQERGVINKSGKVVFRTRNNRISSVFEGGYLFSLDGEGKLKSIIDRRGRSYPTEKYLNLTSFEITTSAIPSPDNIFKIKGIREDYPKTGYFTIKTKGVEAENE